jgi:GT2 family glycosyltransferase
MKNNTPIFSLVFLTWGAEEVIADTLTSVFRQEYDDYEVVVVDNNSQDSTTSIVEQKFGNRKSLQLIENDENLGFSRGINRGIEATSGDYICCYNHDTLLTDGYLSTLHRNISDDSVWTTARINHRVSESHRCVRLLDAARFTVPYVVDGLDGIVPVNFVPGDGVIVPRTVLTEVLNERIFDPRLPPRGEDIALSLQLRSNNIPLRAILDTYSIHPDKINRYALTLTNLKDFIKTYRARTLATQLHDSSLWTQLRTTLSIVTQPVSVYLGSFPRSTDEFIKATNKLER